ncbi:Mov34/MPN/PAD-1 family protein [Pseudomonas hormoni]|uniref:Mov34/MPN/PAD-1 family protein n=1 Tax=Pseudomonas hormoni TaxID=3093767 RepID=A0ABX8EY80_9PSED|nr:Mov34/MPN/PAD-1 family protein [Pseudomonas hormoni]QVW24126.1 Mov34/MPN/PAD-1 family protein [Pseudomonas hormoni]
MQPLSLIDRATCHLVVISPEVLELISFYQQSAPDDCEAGGILIGVMHGAHLEITGATEPQLTDKRTRTRFQRSEVGHQLILNQRWESSGGTENYVGEWHTHPEPDPQPSGIDLREWSRTSRRLGERMIVIIGGLASNYYAVIDDRKCRVLHLIR